MLSIVDVPNASDPFLAPLQSPVKPLRPRALRELVFESLLEAIVSGEINAGDWLNHQRLAERFAVSATPVREALQELASFGIVENQHNKGTVVRPFGPPQLQEIYAVRALLEAEATRLACQRLERKSLVEIEQKTSALLSIKSPNWITEVPVVDKKLHDLLAEACGNQRLKEEIYRYHVFIFIPRTIQLQPHAAVLSEHLVVIQNLLNDQADAAAKAMLEHIHSGGQACSQLLFRDSKPK